MNADIQERLQERARKRRSDGCFRGGTSAFLMHHSTVSIESYYNSVEYRSKPNLLPDNVTSYVDEVDGRLVYSRRSTRVTLRSISTSITSTLRSLLRKLKPAETSHADEFGEHKLPDGVISYFDQQGRIVYSRSPRTYRKRVQEFVRNQIRSLHLW